MSNNTTPAWQSYTVGATVFADGFNWTISSIAKKVTENGRLTRIFTLVNDVTGESVEKTSRGITLWVGGEQSASEVGPSSPDAPKASRGGDGLLDLISDAVRDRLEDHLSATATVDAAQVEAIVEQKLAGIGPQRIEVVHFDGSTVDVGVQHVQFEAVLRAVSQRVNLWLPGPAGSGKTSAAHAVAKALKLPFYAKSVGPQTSESGLLGYYDANGNYVRTLLRECYEHGGVFLFDEIDAGSPAVLVVINSLLANGSAPFPDAVVERHPDCVLLAAANTVGQGADRQYVGRQKIDEATLDRFAFLPWAYDPRIEAAAAGVPVECVSAAKAPEGFEFVADADAAAREQRVQTYVRKVIAIRNAVDSFGKAVRLLVSPRASIHGSKLVRAGFSVNDTLDLCVWKGCDDDTRRKVESAVR